MKEDYFTHWHYNDSSRFSGLIYISDFDTSYEESKNIANRIASDRRFDERCKREVEKRKSLIV